MPGVEQTQRHTGGTILTGNCLSCISLANKSGMAATVDTAGQILREIPIFFLRQQPSSSMIVAWSGIIGRGLCIIFASGAILLIYSRAPRDGGL